MQRDKAIIPQYLSNNQSLQDSVEELNRSGEVSLKSFGKHQITIEDKPQGSPMSDEELIDPMQFYKMRTLNNYE